MSTMNAEIDNPVRLRILRGHTGTVTALHTEWSESRLLSASMADALFFMLSAEYARDCSELLMYCVLFLNPNLAYTTTMSFQFLGKQCIF